MFRFLFYPIELLYRLGFFLAFHFKKIRGGKGPYPFKIISVGNLSVGGTGKSVVVPFLVKKFGEHSSAIVMRGYKGRVIRDGKSHLVTDGKTIMLSSSESGDEAMMYAQQHKIPVVIGKNRARSCDLLVSLITEKGLTITHVLLDDAYQNHAVKKDLEILLLDARKPFDNGHCLPVGYLREKDYTRAQVIFLTHADSVTSQVRHFVAQKLLYKFPQKNIFFGKHAPDGVYFHNNQQISSEILLSKKFILVTGVGSSNGVINTAQQANVSIISVIDFNDHHAYTLKEVENLLDVMKQAGADGILTTSKDWVKIEELCSHESVLKDAPFYVLRVSFEFLSQDEYARFDQLIKESIS